MPKMTKLEEQLRLEDTEDTSHLFDNYEEEYEQTHLSDVDLLALGVDISDYTRDTGDGS